MKTDVDQESAKQKKLAKRLVSALRQEEFVLYCQAIVPPVLGQVQMSPWYEKASLDPSGESAGCLRPRSSVPPAVKEARMKASVRDVRMRR